ncbi:hypothetical protein [Tomitella gaofuii]|uniref:hypothetical protein n=1 Tax=Tomitella gaofuii TaxID=2760083 RepID=UPI0015FB2A2F|nr:hypothetical protein [Tomitella gaofuii]
MIAAIIPVVVCLVSTIVAVWVLRADREMVSQVDEYDRLLHEEWCARMRAINAHADEIDALCRQWLDEQCTPPD